MLYDVFISYSRSDKEWANKLNAELSDHNLNVYLDKRRLSAGDKWEDQLRDALNDSRHMVLLWSDNARQSDWVNKEASYFSVAVSGTDRKLIPLILSSTPKAYSSVQAINDIKDRGLYEKGFASITQNVWDDIIKQIVDSINPTDNRKPIRRIILTVTKVELEAVDLNWVPTFGESLNTVLLQAGYSLQQILDQYGDKKNDWKPFGGQKKITEILKEILTGINENKMVDYKWVPVDESRFWSGPRDETQSQIDILKKELSVIIVDPVALYNQDVRDRFSMMMDCLENKDALVMSFSSFEPSPGYNSWRKLIEYTANRFHSDYFNPAIPKKTMAQFTANPLDKKDAQRFIQQIISESNFSDNKPKNLFLTP